MKTIQQVAAELGTTRQTLYNIVKREGLTFDDFTTQKQGKTRLFDDDAVKRLTMLFDKEDNKTDNEQSIVKPDLTTFTTQIDDLTKQLQQAQEQLARQKEQLEAAAARETKQEQEIERLHEENKALLFTNASLADAMKKAQDQKLLVEPAENTPPAEPAASADTTTKKRMGKIKAAIRKWLELS